MAADPPSIEETGLDVPIGPCVWLRTHSWYFAMRGIWCRSIERYFIAELEKRVVDGWRWWSPEQFDVGE